MAQPLQLFPENRLGMSPVVVAVLVLGAAVRLTGLNATTILPLLFQSSPAQSSSIVNTADGIADDETIELARIMPLQTERETDETTVASRDKRKVERRSAGLIESSITELATDRTVDIAEKFIVPVESKPSINQRVVYFDRATSRSGLDLPTPGFDQPIWKPVVKQLELQEQEQDAGQQSDCFGLEYWPARSAG